MQKLTVSQPLHCTVRYESDHWMSPSGVWSSESRFSKISCVVSRPHLPQTSTVFWPFLFPVVMFAVWLMSSLDQLQNFGSNVFLDLRFRKSCERIAWFRDANNSRCRWQRILSPVIVGPKNMCCKSIKDLAGICELRDVKRADPAGGGWWPFSHFGNKAGCTAKV